MNHHGAAVMEQAGDYAHLFDRASVGGRFDEAGSDGPIRLASDEELVAELAAVSRLIRLAESERAKLAGEIAHRSTGADAETSLARRLGATGAPDLVAQVAGVRRDQGGAIVRLGRAVRGTESLFGEALAAPYPRIAAALAEGRLDPDVARAMIRAVAKSAPGLTPSEALELERQLVERATDGFTADELIAFCKQVPDHAHPEGAEGREARLREAATITRKALDSGLTRWILDLDPLTAGLFQTALDARTAHSRTGLITPDQDDPEVAEPVPDRRPLAQRRIDALRLLAQTVLKVDDGHVAGTAVTMLVHIDQDALLTGLGGATITGVEGTISAATARRLACEARILPVVLGGDSQPLDLGTARRFFTEAQRLAMAARDRGCAGPGCDAPLSWTQAAHISPAGRGATGVENGILLCPRCHRLHDEHGWQVRRDGGRWWWTPPPHVDLLRRPRPGGPVPPLDDLR